MVLLLFKMSTPASSFLHFTFSSSTVIGPQRFTIHAALLLISAVADLLLSPGCLRLSLLFPTRGRGLSVPHQPLQDRLAALEP